MFWRDLGIALTFAVLLIGARIWAFGKFKKFTCSKKEE